MKIAICDDNREQLAMIHDAAEQYLANGKDWSAQIEDFENALLFLESIDKNGGYDIVLLDICMPGILGTDVAKEIRTRRDKTEIIFLTTSDEYAIDAFALKAAHYLLKPFTQELFQEAMDRAMEQFSNGIVKNIVVKVDGGVRMVNINDICYIESQKHLLTIYTKIGSYTERQHSLSRLMEELEKLSQGQFFMPYKGYLVNQKAIVAIEPEEIILQGGARIPIPKRGFRELKNAYFDYMFSQNGGIK